MFVPVVDANQRPLMPTTPSRARRWIRDGKATPFFNKGIFCVRLNTEASGRDVQSIAIGIDPGAKKEGYTVKSEAHTFCNLNVDAVTWVNKTVLMRHYMRRDRRTRNTPCRASRKNRRQSTLPPSTLARWGWKLRVAKWLLKMFPVTAFVVEDIRAEIKKGQRRWNISFSPLGAGKKWFYTELAKLGRLEIKQGWDTKALRDAAGLKKSGKKMAEVFSAHCVDSWVLANWLVGGHIVPDNEQLTLVTPLQFHRRQLHYLQPGKGGVRSRYGGTRSAGFKRGSTVSHSKRGICYVGGIGADGRISLHCIETGKRLCQNAKPEDIKFLAYSSQRTRLLPVIVGN